VSVEDRVAKLGALLARVTERAKAPRKTNGLEPPHTVAEAASVTTPREARAEVAEPVTKEVVLANALALSGDEPFDAAPPEQAKQTEPDRVEVEVTEVEVDDEEALAAVAEAEAAQAADSADELPSRERMVAASPVAAAGAPATTGAPAATVATDRSAALAADDEADRPLTVETGERLAAKRPSDREAEILEPDTETPPDVTLSASDTTEEPPASSRRAIAETEPKLEELAFGDAAPAEQPHAPPPESGRQVAAAPVELDFESEFTGVRPRDAEPASAPMEKKSERPAAASALDASAPEVTTARQAPTARAPLFEGTAPTFKPSSFGELLDATLSL
jgi:hypothetical protein